MYAVVLVVDKLGRRRLAELGQVVVVIVHLLADLIQTVDQVECLHLGEVAVCTKPPALGHLGEGIDVAAQGSHLRGADGRHLQILKGDLVPRGIDFRAGGLDEGGIDLGCAPA